MVRFGKVQQVLPNDDSGLYIIIVGENGQTKKMPLGVDKKGEVEFKTNDVGKVSFTFFNYVFGSTLTLRIE